MTVESDKMGILLDSVNGEQTAIYDTTAFNFKKPFLKVIPETETMNNTDHFASTRNHVTGNASSDEQVDEIPCRDITRVFIFSPFTFKNYFFLFLKMHQLNSEATDESILALFEENSSNPNTAIDERSLSGSSELTHAALLERMPLVIDMVSDVLRKAHTSLGGNGFVKEKLKTTAVVASMSLSQDETSGGDRLVCPTEDGAKANDCILKVETFNN